MGTLAQVNTKPVRQTLSSSAKTGLLQRQCACEHHTVAGSVCAECRQKREGLL
jgi:hypothetical protein